MLCASVECRGVGQVYRREAKLLKQGIVQTTHERLQHRLLFDHMAKALDKSKVYSCPASLVSLETLSSTLGEPATKRRRENCIRPETDLMDSDGNKEGAGVLHFKLVHCSIGKKKTVHTAVGAGGRLRDTDLLVSLHNTLSGFDSTVISARAAAPDNTSGPAFVFSGFTASSLDVLKAGGWWRRQSQIKGLNIFSG